MNRCMLLLFFFLIIKMLLRKWHYLIFSLWLDGEEETDSEHERMCVFEIGESTWSTLCSEEARYKSLASAEQKNIVYISHYLSYYSDKTGFHNMCIIALCTHCHCRELNIQTYTAKYEFSCTGYFQQGRTWYENSTFVQTADPVISNLLVTHI